MPIVRQNAGKLSLDKGGSAGDHLWVAKGCVYQDGGYEKLPEWAELFQQTVTSGHLNYGAHCWRGGQTGRIYAASNSKFFEMSDGVITDVTGNTPTNNTNGVKFASYGEWCFATNGIDEIQTIKVPSTLGAAGNFEDMVYTTGGAKIAPKYICSHKNHIVAAGITFLESYGEIASHTTAVGAAFANQPINGNIEVVSTVAGEVGASYVVTVYGTRSGLGDTVYAEQITLNGVVAAPATSYTNWNIMLGVNCNFTPGGTITLQKVSAGGVITTFTTAAGSGIDAVAAADQAGGDRVLDIVPVSPGTSTKQIGVIGTTPGGTAFWDSQALNGTATVQTNSDFRTFTHILTGDLENTVTVTVSSHQYPAGSVDPYLVWWSGTDDPEGYGTEVLAPQIVGSSNQPLLDGVGKVTGVADGGECFFVFKEGCIYRFDGPPFQPTIINYSVGMNAGLLPYRQGDRVYFWSNSGLNYINIADNSVVPVMIGYASRAVRDYAGLNYGYDNGAFPASRVSAAQVANAVDTAGVATISGDPENGLVLFYYSNSSAPGTNGFVYNEKLDSLTQVYNSTFSSNLPNLVDYRVGSGQVPGVLSYIRAWGRAAATKLSLNKMSVIGLPDGGTDDVYLRWPFLGAQPGGPTTRISRVRPIYNNPATAATQSISFHCLVLSISGTGKGWAVHSVPSVGQGTASLDGWITIDGCPWAERHSIGVSFLGGAGSSSPNPSVCELVGVDVEVVAGSKKGI